MMAVIVGSVIAIACPDNGGTQSIDGGPYNTFFGTKYKVTATAYKCSCNPVNNHLETFLRVQYHDGNNYYWYPEGDGIFSYNDDTNCDSVDVSITRNYPINYGLGVYYKTCNGVFYDTSLEYWDYGV